MTLPFTKLIYSIPLGCLVLLFVIMNSVDPTENVASILLVFLLIYLLAASVLFIMLRVGSRGWNAVASHVSQRLVVNSAGLSRQRAYSMASVLAFMPVSLLAMQSLNQVRAIDIFLVVALTVLAMFYVVKRF